MAALTGLAQRGPAAGFAVAFPDAVSQVWDTSRGRPGREDVDDAGFVSSLIDKMVDDGTARPGPLFLVGMSNGALFVEHLARRGLVAPTGLVLVSGTALVTSRQEVPRPRLPCTVLSVQGTADPVMPYEGGSIGGRGVLGWLHGRRARRRGEPPEDRFLAPAEAVAADWAAANGNMAEPSFESFPTSERGLHLARLSWSAPGQRPVVLYRVEGGGHTWPGGPQYLPARFVGRVSHDFDATGAVLEMARQETERLGRPGTGW
jgi:polyhydroxybutyrate depolymerase